MKTLMKSEAADVSDDGVGVAIAEIRVTNHNKLNRLESFQ